MTSAYSKGTRFFLVLTFFLSFLNATLSQEYITQIRHFGVEEGLSHRDVHCIHQDSRGIIWIGTKYGLNRFDGREFKWYTKDNAGLSSNEIHEILEDGDGNLWLFSRLRWYEQAQISNIDLIDITTEEVIPFDESMNDIIPFKLEDIKGYLKYGENGICFGLNTAKAVVFHSSENFKVIQIDSVNSFYPVWATNKGTIWGEGPDQTLVEIDTLGNQLQVHHFQHIAFFSNGAPAEGPIWFYALEKDEKRYGFYQIDSDLGISEVKDVERSLSKLNDPPHWASHLSFNPLQNQYWYAYRSNLSIISPDQGFINTYKIADDELNQTITKRILFDNNGIAWLATEDGLFQIILKESSFTRHLYYESKNKHHKKWLSTRGIADLRDEKLLVNTYNNPKLIDPKQGSVETVWSDLPNNPISTPIGLYNDRFGYIWYGADVPIRFDPASSLYQSYKYPSKVGHFSDDHIWSIYQDQNDRMWFGTLSGLNYLDAADTVQLFDKYNQFDELAKSHILSIQEDMEGTIWVSALSGLYILDPEKGITDRFHAKGKGHYFLPADHFQYLYHDSDGIYWIGTYEDGLIKWDKSSNEYKQFTVSDGLSNNNIHAIYEDDYGSLWMSSDYGLMQFNKTTEKVNTYLFEDGITHNEFNRVAHFKAKDGRIYFGGLNGVTSFHPAEFQSLKKADELQPNMQIVEFQQFKEQKGEMVDLTSAIRQNTQIMLEPGDNLFYLKFSLIDYHHPEKVHYAYQIEGNNEEWIHQKENTLRISGLPYGRYDLRIKGQRADGSYSDQELQIPIIVLKPYYLKWWFLALISALFIFAVFSFIKWRTHQLKKHRADLRQLVKERTKTIEKQAEELRSLDKLKSNFFSNISHELRTPLTLITGPLKALLKSENMNNREFTYLKLMEQNTENLQKMVTEILDLNKLEASKLELNEEPCDLFELTKRIKASFEVYAQERKINFQLFYSLEKSKKILVDIRKYEKILNNLLSNAIKFTQEGGKITIDVRELNGKVNVSVKDNGRGIHPDDLPYIFKRFYQSKQVDSRLEGGTGVGLAISHEFARLMEGQLWVESTLGQGSTFYFEFPKKTALNQVGEGIEQPERIVFVEEVRYETSIMPSSEISSPKDHPKKQSILLVEDNTDMRHYLSLLLEPYYHIETAENGKIALDFLNGLNQPENSKAGKIDLIISDVMMPVMDGFQLLQNLKSSELWRNIPVIMLTARAALKDKLTGLRIGVDDYLVKPFEEDELLVRISNLLSNYKERLEFVKQEELNNPIGTNMPSLNGEDLQWLEQLEQITKEHLADPMFNVGHLAELLIMSERSLFRKIKKLTGLSPNKYIQEVRLQLAYEMLQNQQYATIKATCYAVGLQNVSYFAQQIQKRFGKLPSEFYAPST